MKRRSVGFNVFMLATASAVTAAGWFSIDCFALSPRERAAAQAYYVRARNGRTDDEPGMNAALKNINAALLIERENPTYVAEKAHILFLLEEDEESLKLAQYAIKLDPLCSQAWSVAGDNLERMGKFEQALPCFDRATKLRPTDWLVEEDKARLLIHMKRWSEAEKCLVHSRVLLRPGNHVSKAPAELGLCYLQQKKWKEAIRNATEGMASYPPHNILRREHYKQRAQAYEALNDYPHAISDYKEILTFVDDRRMYQKILTDYEAMGDEVNAARARKALQAYDSDLMSEEDRRDQHQHTHLAKPK